MLTAALALAFALLNDQTAQTAPPTEQPGAQAQPAQPTPPPAPPAGDQAAPPPPVAPTDQAAPPSPPPPPAEPTLADKAQQFLRVQNFPAAFDMAEKAIAENPQSAKAHYVMGAAAVRLARLDVAEQQLKACFDLVPDYPGLRYYMGQMSLMQADGLTKLGQAAKAQPLYEAAAEHFASELVKAPQDRLTLQGRAVALTKAGKYDDALKAHEAWIEAHGSLIEPFRSLAELYLTQGKLDDALAVVDRMPASDAKGRAPEADRLARWLYTRSKFVDAAKAAEKALSLDDSLAGSYGLLTLTNLKGGRIPEAWQALSTFLAHFPSADQTEQVGDTIVDYLDDKDPDEKIPVSQTGILLPRPFRRSNPDYPSKARKMKMETKVLVIATVAPNGRPIDVKVVRTAATRIQEGLGFDEAAVESVKRWEFRGGKKGNEPATLAFPVLVKFNP